jgi:hypothetical protein
MGAGCLPFLVILIDKSAFLEIQRWQMDRRVEAPGGPRGSSRLGGCRACCAGGVPVSLRLAL